MPIPEQTGVVQGYVMMSTARSTSSAESLRRLLSIAHADLLDPYLVARSHYNLPFWFSKPVVAEC